MSDAVFTEERNGYTIELEYAPAPVDPREEFDHLCTIASFGSSRYAKCDEVLPSEGLPKGAKPFNDDYIYRTVYIYVHSGVALSLAPFSCPWDSGALGVIYISKKSAREAFHCDGDLLEERVEEAMKAEVEEYSAYLAGDVYAFRVMKGDEEVAACYGYYGNSGREQALEEARLSVDSMVKAALENEEEKWAALEESLRHGYYGITISHGTVGMTQVCLYETNIADPCEEWECAEWYLVDDQCKYTLVANCDGYSGVGEEIDDDVLRELLGYSEEEWEDEEHDQFWQRIESYTITGKLLAEAKAATLEDAHVSDECECVIWRDPNYYEGTLGAKFADFLRDDDNEVIVFGSYSEAKAFLDDIASNLYVLDHGEYARPDYRIVKT